MFLRDGEAPRVSGSDLNVAPPRQGREANSTGQSSLQTALEELEVEPSKAPGRWSREKGV